MREGGRTMSSSNKTLRAGKNVGAKRSAFRSLWEERFLFYLRLGESRTVVKAWRGWCGIADNVPDAAMPPIWEQMAKRRRWTLYAEVHDRGALLLDLADDDIDDQERAKRKQTNLLILFQQTLAALGAARLDTLSVDEARTMLPANRLLLVALNNILLSDQNGALPLDMRTGEPRFSAATWGAAVEKVRRDLLAETGASEDGGQRPEDASQKSVVDGSVAQVCAPTVSVDASAPKHTHTRARPSRPSAQPSPTLLVCVGDDPALMIDLAMLRAVRRSTGLGFHRIVAATSHTIADHLRRERELGRPVRWMHLSCHGGSDGLLFADGLVDGDWLSTHLQGVEVLLLAACSGEMIGDWLAVVPHVVTFSDAIGHGDAAVVTKHFWGRIARGDTPDAALQFALVKAQPHVAEFVVRHW